MKIFINFFYFHFTFFLEYYCQDFINNNFKKENILFDKRKLNNDICAIKNCLSCDNRNECIKCKEGFELYKKRCYTKNCEVYGFCKFCDEYDCLKCIKGYKLNYGICNIREKSRKKFYLFLLITITIISLIIYLLCLYKKKIKERISTGKVIRFIHPKSGFYKLEYDVNEEPNMVDISKNKIFEKLSVETNYEKASPIVNCCVVCGNKNTYCISDCGCSLCSEHYKEIKNGKNIKCKIHKIIMSSKISFVMMEKSNIKGNALDKLGLPKCPICKINDGTQSFNCGCTMRVCEKCFNDNVYVFKYNQCPGCGMPYNPIKKEKKRNKSSEESIKK